MAVWGRVSLRSVGRGLPPVWAPLGPNPWPVESQRAKLERPELGVKMEKVVSLKQGLQTRGLWAESSRNSILKLGKLHVKI